ncbi:sensor domain-containing diguanylate cyclase [Paucibacter sp. Y2R2-4]|uniref:GGDEF domain-containing protein n=1 Tax=Paucibacter sp. Y2R2-4 TaxID=2893553 RepID=UPI0021E3B8FE|nr:GGDEF domain-containing protein [Paucibacter sp. Y2R2-4]MCV2350508.1 GGDEF domain-containing protein [Paucibacter sp. Y2R2-4]
MTVFIPFPDLHLPTLLIVYQLVATLMMVIAAGSAWQARGRYGLWYWTGAFAAIALTQLIRNLCMAFGTPTALQTIGHIGGVLSSGLVVLGLRAFLGLPLRSAPVLTLVALASVASMATAFMALPAWTSLSLTLLVSAFLRLWALPALLRAWRRDGGFPLLLMLLDMALWATAYFLRGSTSTPWFAGSVDMARVVNAQWLLLFIALLIVQGLSVLLLINSELQRSLWALIEIDPLTGLLNRRGLKSRLGRLRQRHSGEPDGAGLVVAMIDFDHFKSINDRFGHAAGDAVLRGLGKLLLSHVRPNDLAVRMGGEEFAVVWQEVDAELAMGLAERLRKSVAEISFDTPVGPIQATVSIGVAMPRTESEALEELLGRADSALYKAKREGRNRVEQAF